MMKTKPFDKLLLKRLCEEEIARIEKEAEEEVKKMKHKVVRNYKPISTKDDHRMTLRIPISLIDKLDYARSKEIGCVSRNLMILKILEEHLSVVEVD